MHYSVTGSNVCLQYDLERQKTGVVGTCLRPQAVASECAFHNDCLNGP